jgi:AraC-like DNA-binding protein
MDLLCEERLSDSPYVERIWRSHSNEAGSFTSIAQPDWSMVITRHRGTTTLTVRGPETRATPAYCPADAEFFGIQFKPGTLMPSFPAAMVKDRHDINLPEANGQTFWLDGSAWQYFNYENAETFVTRLARNGLLLHDPVVETILRGEPVTLSLRSVQRRFLQATGLTHNTLFQIRRARFATTLLRQGVSILDTAYLAGYADQPHLTRALKQLVGQTPAQLASHNRIERLSLLFKTETFG